MKTLLTILMLVLAGRAHAQLIVSGKVYDRSGLRPVEGAQVITSSGHLAKSDSTGDYKISASPGDSIFFVYLGKATRKFAVNKLSDYENFNISIGVEVDPRYKLLENVTVRSKSYKEDSIENREHFHKYFDYNTKIDISVSPTGAVGADLDPIINFFRFKYKKRMSNLQSFLKDNEKDAFIRYKFNRTRINKLTGLDKEELDNFMMIYAPGYEFAATASEAEMEEYIRKSFTRYQKTKKD